MASFRKKAGAGRFMGRSASADQIARMKNGSRLPASINAQGTVAGLIPLKQTNALYRAEHDSLAKKVFISIAVLAVLSYLSLGIMGAQGQYYPYTNAYELFNPAQVAWALYIRGYNAVASLTHMFAPYSNSWILENVPGYWAIGHRAGVIGITLICAILLGVSGMLYQNVFKNPIAGPGMLGASSGVNLGMMLLVAMYGAMAPAMLGVRYALCYGLGAAILVFVFVAGKKLSGKGKPFDIVTMLLVGSILGQLLGFVVSYMTLFVMDEEMYAVFYTMSQMLTVDTSTLSWAALGIASAVSLLPVILLRYKFTVLALDEQEARSLGMETPRLQSIALICGAIMILAAQIHVGMVSLVSLVVPFLSRSWFGCEFNKQLTGNFCIGTILLLACRDLTDLIPFVGDGLAIGSIVSIAALPLFAVIMARQMRGWD